MFGYDTVLPLAVSYPVSPVATFGTVSEFDTTEYGSLAKDRSA